MDDRYPVPDMADVRLVTVLGAVADPIRLQIVRDLADGLPHAKSEEAWAFEVNKSTMAHHYTTLRLAGLTRTTVTGRSHAIQLRRAELDARFPGLVEALVAGHDPVS